VSDNVPGKPCEGALLPSRKAEAHQSAKAPRSSRITLRARWCCRRSWLAEPDRNAALARGFLAPAGRLGQTRPSRPYPGASGAAGGVGARRWRILRNNPAMSAASTPPPSATIQTFEPSLAGVAALGDSKTSGASAPPGSLASSPTLGSVLAGRGASPAVSFAYDLGHPLLAIPGDARRFVVQPVSTSGLASQLSPSPR
jgi:hypothetical protein